MRNIDEIISEVEVWRNKTITYEPLNGGESNYTYKINANGVFYVLRINGQQNDFLHLKRSGEVEAIQKAVKKGIAAKIFSSSSEYIISEFKRGKMITKEQSHDPFYIKEIAKNLATIHEIDGIDRECSPFYLVNKYLEGAKSLRVKFPDGLDKVLNNVTEIENRSSQNSKYINRYCHNDYYIFNMIDNNGDICVVDWELSGMGNIFFDLATISFFSAYSDEEDKMLLEGYFGYCEDELKILLHDMKYMNMLREVAWALMHSGMDVEKVNHDTDYYKNVLWFLERLKDGYVTV